MPASSMATVRRDGDALVFAGSLDRAACATLWAKARPLLDGTRRLDLRQADRIDSAGLALLAELAELAGRVDVDDVDGHPDGLAELRSAYRLDERLGYAT